MWDDDHDTIQKRAENNLSTIFWNKHREKTHELTSESPVYILDSPVQNTAASLLNPAACCHSGPDVLDGRGWTSELRPEKHSWSLTDGTTTIWIKYKWWR